MNRDAFTGDLDVLLKKHRIWLSGTLKIRSLDNDWDETTSRCSIVDEDGAFPYKDTDGPFLALTVLQKPRENTFSARNINVTIMDKDKLLANGVLSPLDMKTAFHNRRDYAEHLKVNGCVEIGNDFNKSTEKKREIKGDFDCRNELAKATHKVMEKYGN